jgi:N-acetylmuramoyl-L-alanine amidase
VRIGVACTILLLAIAGARIARPVGEPPGRSAVTAELPESAPVREVDGAWVIGANDLARLLDATKFWRGDIRKLVLRTRSHRIVLNADNPFVLVDDRTVRLALPVLPQGGELQVPVALVDSLPSDSLTTRLFYDPIRRVVFQVPAGGVMRSPRVAIEDGETRLELPIDRPEGAWIATRSRAHFRVHFGAFFVGTLPDSFPESSLVISTQRLPSVTGTAFELRLAPGTAGFRLERDPGRVTLVFSSRTGADLEPFARESPPGPRALRVVVIDAGHGGPDLGVSSGGAVEKTLTLSLARLLKTELERRLSARVVLTREDDRVMSLEERAERANRARADLVISLHFDGVTGTSTHGATAWFPPAAYATSVADPEPTSSGVAVLTWRDVATRHAVASRELAEAVLSSLDLRGQGPTRLREVLPSAMLGVNAPGMMLECATLTSDLDRQRVLESDGLGHARARHRRRHRRLPAW